MTSYVGRLFPSVSAVDRHTAARRRGIGENERDRGPTKVIRSVHAQLLLRHYLKSLCFCSVGDHSLWKPQFFELDVLRRIISQELYSESLLGQLLPDEKFWVVSILKTRALRWPCKRYYEGPMTSFAFSPSIFEVDQKTPPCTNWN